MSDPATPSAPFRETTQMLRRLLRASLVAVAGMAVAACGGADQSGPRSATPAGGEAGAAVIVADMSFSPAEIRSRVGDTVVWSWDDGPVEHDVDFADGPASRRQRTGTWRRTFDRPGTYDYVCTLHPGMTGRVVVE